MIPEMKLGVIALSNFDLDESMFSFSTLEILIPAFTSWINSMQSVYNTNYGKLNITKFVGKYYADDIPAIDIFIDSDTNNLMLSSVLDGFYGLLTWMGDNINNGNSMIYNDLNDDAQSCWIKTLSSFDGTTVQFVTNKNGDIDGVMLPDDEWRQTYKKKNIPRNKQNQYNKWKNKQQRKTFKTKISSKNK